jgi:hypothetical protein
MEAGEMPTDDLIARPRFLREASTHWVGVGRQPGKGRHTCFLQCRNWVPTYYSCQATELLSNPVHRGPLALAVSLRYYRLACCRRSSAACWDLSQQSLCYSFALETSLENQFFFVPNLGGRMGTVRTTSGTRSGKLIWTKVTGEIGLLVTENSRGF